jgi:hypothetical protein
MGLCLNPASLAFDLGSWVAIGSATFQQRLRRTDHDALSKARELRDGLPTKVPTMAKTGSEAEKP